MKLDLLKDKWFFTPKDDAENRAFQDWAFAQGMTWATTGKTYIDHYKDSIGGNTFKEGHLGYAGAEWYKSRGSVQIFPEFSTKVVVDYLVLPDLESPQQKQIRELEATIALATQQIEALKKDI